MRRQKAPAVTVESVTAHETVLASPQDHQRKWLAEHEASFTLYEVLRCRLYFSRWRIRLGLDLRIAVQTIQTRAREKLKSFAKTVDRIELLARKHILVDSRDIKEWTLFEQRCIDRQLLTVFVPPVTKIDGRSVPKIDSKSDKARILEQLIASGAGWILHVAGLCPDVTTDAPTGDIMWRGWLSVSDLPHEAMDEKDDRSRSSTNRSSISVSVSPLKLMSSLSGSFSGSTTRRERRRFGVVHLERDGPYLSMYKSISMSTLRGIDGMVVGELDPPLRKQLTKQMTTGRVRLFDAAIDTASSGWGATVRLDGATVTISIGGTSIEARCYAPHAMGFDSAAMEAMPGLSRVLSGSSDPTMSTGTGTGTGTGDQHTAAAKVAKLLVDRIRTAQGLHRGGRDAVPASPQPSRAMSATSHVVDGRTSAKKLHKFHKRYSKAMHLVGKNESEKHLILQAVSECSAPVLARSLSISATRDATRVTPQVMLLATMRVVERSKALARALIEIDPLSSSQFDGLASQLERLAAVQLGQSAKAIAEAKEKEEEEEEEAKKKKSKLAKASAAPSRRTAFRANGHRNRWAMMRLLESVRGLGEKVKDETTRVATTITETLKDETSKVATSIMIGIKGDEEEQNEEDLRRDVEQRQRRSQRRMVAALEGILQSDEGQRAIQKATLIEAQVFINSPVMQNYFKRVWRGPLLHFAIMEHEDYPVVLAMCLVLLFLLHLILMPVVAPMLALVPPLSGYLKTAMRPPGPRPECWFEGRLYPKPQTSARYLKYFSLVNEKSLVRLFTELESIRASLFVFDVPMFKCARAAILEFTFACLMTLPTTATLRQWRLSYFCLIWAMSGLLWEANQLVSAQVNLRSGSIKHRIKYVQQLLAVYVSDRFNRFDLPAMLLTIWALLEMRGETGVLHNGYPSDLVRTLRAVSALLLWARQMRATTLSPTFGPYILMVFKMLQDTFIFLGLLAGVNVSFAAAFHLLYEEAPSDHDASLLNEGLYWWQAPRECNDFFRDCA